MNELHIDKTHWKKTKIGELLYKTEYNDKEHASERYNRFIKMEHLDAYSLNIHRWGDSTIDEIPPTFYKVFKQGQILYPTRNPQLKRTALASFDGICGEKTLTLSLNEDSDGYVPFIAHVFHSSRFIEYATNARIGSTNPHIRWRDVADYEFLLPPKAEQKRLAELLWAADEVVEKEKREREKMEGFFEAYLHYGFEDSNFNANLYSCINGLIGGGTPNTKKEEFYCDFDGIPWVTSISLESIYINKGERHITQLGIKQSATNILPEGNIILGTRVGVGKCSINNAAMCFSQDSTGLIIKKEIIDPVFLLFTLRSSYSQKYFKSHSRGTTIQGITKEDLLKLPVWIPNMKQQLSIAERCTNMVNSIEKSKKLLEQSQQIKQELINKVF